MELSQNKYFMEEQLLPTDTDSSSEAEESSSVISYSVYREGDEPPPPQCTWTKVQSKKKGKKKQKKNKNKQPVSPPQPAIPAIETTDAQIASWCIQFEQHVLQLLEENFQQITSGTVQEQGKRLIKTFGAAAEPVRYKAISQRTNILNTLVSLVVHSGLRVFECYLHQPEFFEKVSSNFEKKVGDTVVKEMSCGMQNPVNSGDSHLVTPPIIPEIGISQPGTSSKSLIMPEQRPSTADEELINVNMENANDDNPIPLQPSGSSNTTPNDKKKKKVTDKSVEKIFVDANIPDEKVNNIRDIFIYDVPSSWSHEKILAELKAWGDPISMTVKKQRKYQTLRIKICLSTFALASFEQGIWQYSLGNISVRWFPGNWSLHQRKKREQFRLYINDLPQESCYWSTWERTASPQEMFGHLPIKAIKHFETGGKVSIVVFFEKYENVEICRKTRFNFNHNDVDYSLPWCSAPLTASQTKQSKDSSGSTKKSKSKDSSKKTKNSSSSKTHSANSKPNKDKTKTSKKSKDKKKKKSSGKKTDDKMDIVKLLLTLISKF
ncbi:hypothetical protein GLOIN_2v1662849 [Rhizophagus clarus]|uniref:Uncharacterized protein n=1 Tax=Rhizophagus clarus TaxID=94130 RepID=A0A8H3LSJ4_9GLOM|nr:hypothetical protein GLOIN_2v1662849 [Rhizophagus clarus]